MIEIISAENAEVRRKRLARVKARGVATDLALMRDVSEIIQSVRENGDAALVDYARKFDGVTLLPAELRVDTHDLVESASRVDSDVLTAIRAAIANVRRFHEHELTESWEFDSDDGVRLGQRISAVESGGLYVPGGTASYPSSVVMNVVPAQVAGVRRIAVCTPPHTILSTPAVAAALLELEVKEIYQVGGAQAIAALAFGTETIASVDVITGPGNKYVAAAKKLVYGVVGIDSIAGPTEVVIVADEAARADFVAADLLAQAEHAEDACAILITTSTTLASSVVEELRRQSATLPRADLVSKSLADFGAVIVVRDLNEACDVVNELAPEHLEILVNDEAFVSDRVRHAGAMFFGPNSPEAVGDYLAGPNHVLPTGAASRFSSALSVHSFQRRTSLIRYTRKRLNETAQLVAALARAEGLEAHARSALVRLEGE